MSNRNTNSRFDLAPQVEIQRSTFSRDFSVKTSFNVGELVPFYVDEVLPGDTFEIDTSKVMRLQTLMTPVMDNLYLDTYYFFVPNRLVWEHWREFCGENTTGHWVPDVEYTVPQLFAPAETGWSVGTIADYFGLPVNVPDYPVNALPFRAYALICNEWFRDENLTDPCFISTGDVSYIGSNGDDYLNDVVRGGKPFLAAKFHDYFTSAQVAPQKGPDVTIPFGNNSEWPYISVTTVPDQYATVPEYALKFASVTNPSTPVPTGNLVSWHGDAGVVSNTVPGSNITLGPLNLGAPIEQLAPTINDLRHAFQIQRLLERDQRGGTRYIELIRSHFGVESPDARLQRPEYLGGNRVPFNIEQVTQTSSTTSGSGALYPLGGQAAYSHTVDNSQDVRKSFTEHGFIIGLVCARYDHTYQQGINRMWSRLGRFDYYWPALAHLGEQAVLNKEIYVDGSDEDDEVFGYQEAWAEYRYMPNLICGEMRSAHTAPLDIWHFADDYESRPYLSDEWIREDSSNIDRALAVKSGAAHQIFGDILVSNRVTRPMPLYSIPGMIDHF